ncbi:hypothetical protein GZH47_24580 [Paenibacillus rhizovicinus]|uniref:Uncharacterized protein n=1 Tax=Paenibacillus rhizovicinus TaxID=2704463 RepID=A0A6C0P584_9BACL|nr:hypothetical protein [Paenibacillus rhizovicinus]QHW33659.1 hypothetical protein GZH47_24580 [Paenibacillus rhizovicinus]
MAASGEMKAKLEFGPQLGIYLSVFQIGMAGLEGMAGIRGEVTIKAMGLSTAGGVTPLCYQNEWDFFARAQASIIVDLWLKSFKWDVELGEATLPISGQNTCQEDLTLDEAKRIVLDGITLVNHLGRADAQMNLSEEAIQRKYAGHHKEISKYFSDRIIDRMFGYYEQYFLRQDTFTDETEIRRSFDFAPKLTGAEDEFALNLRNPYLLDGMGSTHAYKEKFTFLYMADQWMVDDISVDNSYDYDTNAPIPDFSLDLSIDEAKKLLSDDEYLKSLHAQNIKFVDELAPTTSWKQAPQFGYYDRFTFTTDDGPMAYLVMKETGETFDYQKVTGVKPNGGAVTVQTLKNDAFYQTSMLDDAGQAYDVYVYAGNQTTETSEFSWACATEGATTYSGNYDIYAVNKSTGKMIKLNIGNQTLDKEFNRALTVTGATNLLGISECEGTNAFGDALYYIHAGKIILIKTSEGYGGVGVATPLRIKCTAKNTFQTLNYYRDDDRPWILDTYQLNPATGILKNIKTQTFKFNQRPSF